ncbi:hypothetical protein LK09_00285 [Microbacterium mangrovi]|uniref:MarR family transcriptional regulator n=1 Tax=Microbacterium mangrovi TaxID=1348253 RepID=A0A0B2ADV5_9MICO|nr:DUF488 family protein [Microbacterium mangrovi]KHK99821.1 hypothetical protein LK09_00285 [Microbacterium mangrovi]
MSIRLARIYDAPGSDDGYRVLVDRLWPRGVSKERAELDEWAKDAAPSTELRRAFHAGELVGDAFDAAYRTELADNPAVPALRERLAEHPTTTLLTATHDEQHSYLAVLRDVLEGR